MRGLEVLNQLLDHLGYPLSKDREAARKEAFTKILVSSTQGIRVAEDNTEVVGFISYSILPQLRHSGNKMEIDELSVAASQSGKGVGARLLEHALKIAREQNVKKVIVSSSRQRESYTRSFYQKQGFVEKDSAFFQMEL